MSPSTLRLVLAVNDWLRLPLLCKLGLHSAARCNDAHARDAIVLGGCNDLPGSVISRNSRMRAGDRRVGDRMIAR